MITHYEMIGRIAAGAALGGVIGFERDIHGRQVGLRTHLIVAMASATFMVISAHFYDFQHYDRVMEDDVSRIAASIVSAVGFLAGGAILKTGVTIQGITTAAGLWLVTSIGMASGAGMFPEAISVTIMGLIALTIFRLFEDKNDKLIRRHVSLVMADAADRIPRLMKKLDELGAKVTDFDYEKEIAGQKVSVNFESRFPISLGVNGFIAALEKEEGVKEIHVKLHE